MSKSVLSGSAALFLMRISGAGVGFLTQILLAQTLGSHDLGVFYSATSLATVAGFVMSQGYSQIAYRFSARYRDDSRSALFRAFTNRAAYDSLVASTAAAVVVVALSLLWPDTDATTRVMYALAGALIIPSTALVVYTNLAGAIRKFGWCYVPEGLVRPVLFLGAVLALKFGLADPGGADVMLAFSILVVGVAVTVWMALRPHLPQFGLPRPSARRLAARWRAEARPLVLLSLYTNSFADVSILFATPFLSQSELAVFGVCLKLSLLIGYFVQIGQQMAIPDLADAREKGDRPGMRRAARKSVALPLAMTVVSFAGCALLGREILGFFGAEFVSAGDVLLIMVATQVVRAMAGPSAHLLTLSGAQTLNASLCVGALVTLLAADALLGRPFGPAGAAWAVFVSYTGWILATAVALNRLGEMRTDLAALFGRGREPAPALAE